MMVEIPRSRAASTTARMSLSIAVVVHAGRRLVGFPEEEQADHVEAQVAQQVEVGGAGARRERGDLGIAGEIHAAEDHDAALPSTKCRPAIRSRGAWVVLAGVAGVKATDVVKVVS